MTMSDDLARGEAERLWPSKTDALCAAQRYGFTLGAAWQSTRPRPDVGDLRERAIEAAYRAVDDDLPADPTGEQLLAAVTRAADAVLATLPAPVVSGEAVRAAVCHVANVIAVNECRRFEYGHEHDADDCPTARAAIDTTLAALGITVADTPEAGER